MSKLFHLIPKNEWLKIHQDSEYTPQSLSDCGFIHLSKADQILNVANSLYKKNSEALVILRIDSEKL